MDLEWHTLGCSCVGIGLEWHILEWSYLSYMGMGLECHVLGCSCTGLGLEWHWVEMGSGTGLKWEVAGAVEGGILGGIPPRRPVEALGSLGRIPSLGNKGCRAVKIVNP